MAQNHPRWRLMSVEVWCYALLVVHARQKEERRIILMKRTTSNNTKP